MTTPPSTSQRDRDPEHNSRAREPEPGHALDKLRAVMDRLLGEDGCAWDREQSLETLRPFLLEETHEVLDALDRRDVAGHRAELGDLLFQIVFHAALREREGAFDLDDVIGGITDKLIRRHPHVFAPAGDQPRPRTAAEVDRLWNAIKARERASAGAQGDAAGAPDPLAGIPRTLPALMRASRLQGRAAQLGFDWPDADGPAAKAREELAEFDEARASGDRDHMLEEFGDLLFVLVRLGDKLGLDAEDALRRANEKFTARFAHVVQRCRELEVDPAQAGLARLDGFWDEAKRLGIGTPKGPAGGGPAPQTP